MVLFCFGGMSGESWRAFLPDIAIAMLPGDDDDSSGIEFWWPYLL